MPHRISAACLLALGLAACGFKVEQKAPPINPAPKDAYRFEVWVEDPPRPMRVESMTASFQDMQSGCLPRKPVSGALAVDDISEQPVTFEPAGEGRYRATVHADSLLQTDLYGLGICDWRLIGVETLWSDGALRYLHFARVLPLNDEPFPLAEFAVFARESRGMRDDKGLPLLALPIMSEEGNGPWPLDEYEDINRRRVNASTGAIEAWGPYRHLSPQTDFRVMSLSRRADDF